MIPFHPFQTILNMYISLYKGASLQYYPTDEFNKIKLVYYQLTAIEEQNGPLGNEQYVNTLTLLQNQYIVYHASLKSHLYPIYSQTT